MAGEWLVFIGLMATMVAGVFIIVTGIRHRAQSLEMAHRERMAMIEKGIVPSPETNPGHAAWAGATGSAGFQRMLHDRPTYSSQRSLTLGIVIVAIGVGFMILIGIAARTPDVAIGIGGAIVVVGVAFIVIAQVKRSAPPAQMPPTQMMQPPPLPVPRNQSISDRPPDPSL
jgi:uncharacterized membrane protein HdeD (DUF308 family)